MNENEDKPAEGLEHQIATVATVEDDGLTLIFDGENASDGKSYPCNASIAFAEGDRVKVEKDSGTYLVDFTIGAPGSKSPIPSGGAAGQYLKKTDAADYVCEWADLSGILPTGGTTGQFLKKTGTADYACEWSGISGLLPAGGTTGQFLKKTGNANYACSWESLSVDGTLPTGGTTGQFLKKTGNTNYACSWSDLSVSGLLPTGGSAGQFLSKRSVTNFDCEWTTPPVSGSSTSIGFMGARAVAKKSVSKLYSTATLATVISKVNEVLTDLADYGLLTSY